MSRTMFRLEALEAYSRRFAEKLMRFPCMTCTSLNSILVRPSPSETANGSTLPSYHAPHVSSVYLFWRMSELMPK